eukprot:365219-Chlamydomonas_euryale.AAC.35
MLSPVNLLTLQAGGSRRLRRLRRSRAQRPTRTPAEPPPTAGTGAGSDGPAPQTAAAVVRQGARVGQAGAGIMDARWQSGSTGGRVLPVNVCEWTHACMALHEEAPRQPPVCALVSQRPCCFWLWCCCFCCCAGSSSGGSGFASSAADLCANGAPGFIGLCAPATAAVPLAACTPNVLTPWIFSDQCRATTAHRSQQPHGQVRVARRSQCQLQASGLSVAHPRRQVSARASSCAAASLHAPGALLLA